VVAISDDPQRFAPGAILVHGNGRVLTVETARAHGNRFLVKFAGVGSRDEARELRGSLYVDANELRQLDEGEFWEHDLIGSRVQLADGSEVGRIRRLIKNPAQDLLEVSTPDGTALVPVVKEIVVRVDVNERVVVIDPPEGLLEGS
jgi:16S rRNA processing protein RimM